MSNKIGVSSEFCLTFIRNARFRRTSQLDLLREENLALLNIINDFDARLATVEAERDALQQRLDSVSKLPVIELAQHRRISRTGSLSRDII